MALNKVTYVDEETVIHAENLNDIQDEIISNGERIADAEQDIIEQSSRIAKLESSSEANANVHMGFFRDAQGYLCEI